MKSIVRILIVVALLGSIAINIGVAQEDDIDRSDWPETFSLGRFAGDDSAEALLNAEPLARYLEEELGIPVFVNVGSTYSAVIAALRANQVDAFEVGPFSYVIAEREANAEAIAVGAVEGSLEGLISGELDINDIRPFYYSVFVTKKGNVNPITGEAIDSLEDFEGVDFAFVDPASTSGRNAPVLRLIDDIEGLETPSDVDEWLNPIFAGSHPSAVLALINDDVVGAVTFEGNLINQRAEGLAEVCGFEDDLVGITLTPEDIQQIYDDCPDGSLVVIAQSPPIPNTPFAVRSDLPQSLKDAVKDALLAIIEDPELIERVGRVYVDPAEIPALADALGIETIMDFYDPVRAIADITAEQ
ncbi:MAG: phosphate/phosphite/phosphonate ABC transporter substrate-binding protein [Chloroflexota bacterium]